MINEKILIETLANHTERLADLQQAFAGLTSFVESRLPNLSSEEKEMLKNGVKAQMSDAEALKDGVKNLRQALQNL
jgi:hypothetical protein